MQELSKEDWEESKSAYFIEWLLQKDPNCLGLQRVYDNVDKIYLVRGLAKITH